jgi:hypothetical protein
MVVIQPVPLHHRQARWPTPMPMATDADLTDLPYGTTRQSY